MQLWAADSGGRPTVDASQIDVATGTVLSTKSIGILAPSSVVDFASDPIRDPSVVWAVRWTSISNQLVAIDPSHSQLLSSVPITSATPIQSLAIDPTHGVMYGGGGTSLYEINRVTGGATFVGTASSALDKALAFDAAGNLYGIIDGNKLATINKSTGAAATIATLPITLEDMAASPDTGIMYGIGAGASPYSLFQINLATGAVTTIGPSLLRPSSLAFTGVPEPSSFAIFFLALIGARFRRRR